MNWAGRVKLNIKNITYTFITLISVVTILMLIVMINDSNGGKQSLIDGTPKALNEIIMDTSYGAYQNEVESGNEAEESNSSVRVNNVALPNTISDKATDISNGDYYTVNTNNKESIALMTVANEEVDIDPYEIIANDIEAIKNGDKEVITRYFSNSVVFSPDIVADKLAATLVSFISTNKNEDENTEVLIHICTLDYKKMLEANKQIKENLISQGVSEDEVAEQVKKELARGIVKGEYESHYNIPVVVENGYVRVTEELKEAITGGWYTGINTQLQNVTCPLVNNTNS